METIQWMFGGVGTAVVSGLLGIIVGGFAGYGIGVSSKNRQKQKAGSQSNQKQVIQINNKDNGKE